MKTLVLLIAAFAFAGQILIARSKKCTTADDCKDVANSNNQCNTVKTKTNTCECKTDYVPTATGCGKTTAKPVIKGTTTILIDETLVLTCQSESEMNDMTYKWTRNGVDAVPNQSTKTFIIYNVADSAAGTYKCQPIHGTPIATVTYTKSDDKKITLLKNLPKPVIKGIQTVVTEKPILLVCGLSEDMDVEYQWTLPKKDLKKENVNKNFYEVSKATKDYEGEYKCTVTSKTLTSKTSESQAFKVTITNGVAEVAGSVLVMMAAVITSKVF